MGENVLELQAKNTQKRRARVAADNEHGRLFQTDNRIHDEFTVDVVVDKLPVQVGDILFCFPGNGEAPIDVVHQCTKVGTAKDSGGEVLHELVQKTGCQAVIVKSICEITDTLKVQMKVD